MRACAIYLKYQLDSVIFVWGSSSTKKLMERLGSHPAVLAFTMSPRHTYIILSTVSHKQTSFGKVPPPTLLFYAYVLEPMRDT